MSDDEPRIHIVSRTGVTYETASNLGGLAAPNRTADPSEPELATLRQLTALSRAVAQAESFDDILKMAAHQAATMLGADQAVLILIGDDGTAHVRATHGVNPTLMDKLEGVLNERFIQQLESVLVGTASRAFMAVPLIVQREVTGLLAVVRNGRPPWTSKDEAMLAAVADQSAAPIEIARLSEEVRQARLVAENVRLSEAERLARAELETERARLATVLDNIPSGVVLVEAPTGRVTFVNRAVAQLLRLPDTAALNKAVDVLDASVRSDGRPYPPGEWPLARALAHGETIVGEDVECVRGDGTSATFSVNAAAIRNADNVIVAAVSTFSDVTSRRRIDQHLRQVQRMDAVGKLAGGVAHEVNNMMTVVLGFTDFLLGGLGQGDARRRDLEQVRAAAGRAAAVTAQLLAFSRRQLLQPQVLSLADVVDELQPVFQRLLGEDKELHIRRAPGVHHVKADRSQFEQVLINLLLNARDAMPHGGRVTIETTNVVLDAAYAARHPPVATVSGGSYVLLAVTDTGVGMDRATAQRIFEPFYTTKPVGQGTGLGLSVVYGIVKQSDGYIWVYSEPDQGTTFKVYLPAVTETGEQPPLPISPPTAARGSETILVVEDEEMVRSWMVRFLEQHGYRCLEAGDGLDAMQVIQSHTGPIDLVVTDILMPRMNGRELAEHLARVRPDLPMLFLSGFTGDEMMRRNLLPPGAPFLQKPFDTQAFTTTLRELLRV